MKRLCCFRLATLALAIVLGAYLSSEADEGSAGEPPPEKAAKKSKKEPEPQGESNEQLVKARHLLQSVKLTLEQADHDYGGHRAAAVRDIGKAQKQLTEALKHQGVQGKGASKAVKAATKAAAKSLGEPQKLSNAQLAEAIPALQGTIAFLEKADHDYGGHKKQAIEDLQVAIAQLTKALKYAAVFDKGKP